MRRRRQVLQVSTFPFLAVLLCTMGSLILILMVMDRRARIVARARAQQHIDRIVGERRAAIQARLQEQQRLRQSRRDQLTIELHAIQKKQALVEDRTARTLDAIGSIEDEIPQHRQSIDSEKQALRDAEHALHQARIRHSAAEEKARQAQAELARLTAELHDLEQTVGRLQQLRARQAQTWSLVPYGGKHGENRRPIYLECTAGSVIFHPDGLILAGLSLTPLAIRLELDRRVAALGRAAGADRRPENQPYILILLRPTGIATWYLVMASLEGLPIDFGYEFIDDDWQLAFPRDDSDPVAGQPWMKPASSIDGVSKDRSRPGSAGTDGTGGVRQEMVPYPLPGYTGSGGSRHGVALGSPQPGPPPLPPLGSPSARIGDRPSDNRGKSSPDVPAGTGIGPAQARLDRPPSAFLAGTSEPPPKSPPAGTGPVRSTPPGSPERFGNPGSSNNPASSSPAGSERRLDQQTSPAPVDGERPADQLASDATPAAGSPGSGQGSRLGTEPASKSTSRVRLSPNRDWIIRVECKSDGVVLPGTGEHFPLIVLGPQGDQPLVAAVRRMIERKQATVRPGELEFHPQLRFIVHPDGFRSYYSAYPALGLLRLPMSRELREEE